MFRLTLLLTLLWLPSLLVGYDQLGEFFYLRHQLTMYTGFLGLGYMCIAVLLAARFRWVESMVNGLDKGYALHKKLGIGATLSLFCHWLIIKSGQWLVEAELIARPNRGKPPVIEGINWHAVAEQVGDISFKVFLIFSLISLVQAISYKRFKFTHKIGGILVLAGVFHAVFLLDWNISSFAMNLTIIALSVIGLWCSCLSLFGKIGTNNKVKGNVVTLEKFDSVVRFSVKLDNKLEYKEGQFAYLDFKDGESPHPFSVLSYDEENNIVSFGVKDLGDYTHNLVKTLKKNAPVTVEGCYGQFQISSSSHQVWVGAGIGIVPFISRLYWLHKRSKTAANSYNKIVLYYCVNSSREAFFEKEIVNLLTKLDFIELHVLDAQRGELLNGEQIATKMAGKSYDVSFCGPASFGTTLQSYLSLTGLPEANFHKEIFKMR